MPKVGVDRVSIALVTGHNKAQFDQILHDCMAAADRHESFGAYFDWDFDAKSDWVKALFLIVGNGEPMGVGWLDINRTSDSASVNIAIMPERRRRGGGLYGCRAMIRYAFERLGMNRVEATVLGGNEASLAMTKGGMREEGRRRQGAKVAGRYVDVVYFGLLRSDWERQVGRS